MAARMLLELLIPLTVFAGGMLWLMTWLTHRKKKKEPPKKTTKPQDDMYEIWRSPPD